MAEKKGGEKSAKGSKETAPKEKSAAAKLVEGVSKAAKAVADAVAHPKATAKEVVKEARDKVVDAILPHAGEATAASNGHDAHERGIKRTLTGFVKSDKMDKTVVVEVVSMKRDPVYGKYLKDRMRYQAHDEQNQYKTGDKVEIREHRPLSRHKRWIVSKLIERARPE